MVSCSRDAVAASLDDDDAIASLFPDTRVKSVGDGVRETRTPAPVGSRDVRFVWRTQPDGNLAFEKVCDGNIWRSLEGEVRLESVDAGTTRVRLRLEGRTRTLVPELTIRAPLRAQIQEMSAALQSRIERAYTGGQGEDA